MCRFIAAIPVSIIPRFYPPRMGANLVTPPGAVNAGCDHD
jgi:hypothetical protein